MAASFIFDLIDENLAELTEADREQFPKATIVRGNKDLEDTDKASTIKCTGGVGINIENLPESVIQQADEIIETEYMGHANKYAAFKQLDIVILASSRNRRYFGELDGRQSMLCGSNQDGRNAIGFSGVGCSNCVHKEIGSDGKRECTAYITVLAYLPRFDITVLFHFNGMDYMPATEMLDYVKKLRKEYSRRIGLPSKNMVNAYFFKVTIKAAAFVKTYHGTWVTALLFVRYPDGEYPWENLLAAHDGKTENIAGSEVLMPNEDKIRRIKDYAAEYQDRWLKEYTEHVTSAVYSLTEAPKAPMVHDGQLITDPATAKRLTQTAQSGKVAQVTPQKPEASEQTGFAGIKKPTIEVSQVQAKTSQDLKEIAGF